MPEFEKIRRKESMEISGRGTIYSIPPKTYQHQRCAIPGAAPRNVVCDILQRTPANQPSRRLLGPGTRRRECALPARLLLTPNPTSIAIVGAGPYGLSIAAHLSHHGVPFTIFGKPMQIWRERMPQGMLLKSEGFASSLYDPQKSFTLRHFCAENGIPYQDIGSPVALKAFADYGMEFQRRFAPGLQSSEVTRLSRSGDGFLLEAEDGQRLAPTTVVLAVGISHFEHIPVVLRELPPSLATHSSEHSSLERFSGKRVVVLGAGASAVDLAVLLHEAGAQVDLVARGASIAFHLQGAGEPRPLLQRMRSPRSGLGTGWRSFLSSEAPLLFHSLPARVRLRAVKRHLGPAPGWFMRERFVGRVATHMSTTVEGAEAQGEQVRLALKGAQGRSVLLADHVIAATGYEVDLERLAFLDHNLRASISTLERAPILSRNFETSVQGLYMAGLASANSFGPLARFACGAEFTAKHLTRHLRKQLADR